MFEAFTYKGFSGSIQFSSSDQVYYGKLEEVDDLVTFEGESKQTLKSAFEEAVEDYIDLRKDIFL